MRRSGGRVPRHASPTRSSSRDTITFTGFGKFSTSERAAREGVNPRNPSQKVHIPAATVPKFSAGSQLKAAVKGGYRPAASSSFRGTAAAAPPSAAFSFGRCSTNICSPRLRAMQLAFDSADRLVELVEARHGPVPAEDAARALFALRARARGPRALAARRRRRGRCAARLARRERRARRAARRARSPLEHGDVRRRRPGDDGPLAGHARDLRDRRRPRPRARAARTLRDAREPARPLPAPIGGADRASTRARSAARRRSSSPCGASSSSPATPCSSRTTRASTSAFLDREVERLTGRRIAAPVVDTRLARAPPARGPDRAHAGSRRSRTSSAPRARPCHRALPDARGDGRDPARADRPRAGAGRETVARARRPRGAARAAARAASARSSPARRRSPGVYLFRDRNDQVLYVGRARDLRARLRSYFRTERQRPAVEAALGALERVEWRVLGSELEAGARGAAAPARAAAARRTRAARGPTATSTSAAAAPAGASPRRLARMGPLKSRRRRAELRRGRSRRLGGRARAAALPALRAKLRRLAAAPSLRGRGAAARPDRGARGGRRDARGARAPARARALPARAGAEEGFARAFFVSGGRVAADAHAAARRRGPRRARRGPRRGRRAEPSLGRRRTPTSCSWSARSCAGRRRSCERRCRWRRLRPRCLVLGPMALRRHRDLRRPARGRGRAEAQPARRRARPAPRPAARRAARRGGARPGRGRERGRPLLLRDRRRRRAVRRRRQAAGRVLRGARRRRLRRARGVCAYARDAGLLVIADAKRGDIGSTARAYAERLPRAARRRSRRSPTR